MRETKRLAIPSAPEAEAALLGGMILHPENIARVASLEPEAFHDSMRAEVYRAVQRLYSKGHPIDPVSVHLDMRAAGSDALIEDVHDLTAYAPGPASMRMYAGVIADCHRLRQLMIAGQQISEFAMTPGRSSVEQIDKAQMLLAKLATVRARRDPQYIIDTLSGYLEHLQEMSEGKNPAIPTGIGRLDSLLNGGMRRGEVMVIGARPKHGKTALALAIARNVASAFSVLFLSQEMPVRQLMHRHTAAAGSIELGRILAADPLDADMWDRVYDAARRLEALKLAHDDQGSLSLMDVRRKAIKVKRERGLDVLFVDFLQLMVGAGGDDNRNREIDVIVNGLKTLAMDLDMVVVVLSQMNRKADEHYGRPTMTHLRESGAIEAAADQIALLFTDWAHPLSKRTSEFEGYSELEIVAHRNGPQGVVPLEFIGKYQQMGDWMRDIPIRHAATPSAPMPPLRNRGAKF